MDEPLAPFARAKEPDAKRPRLRRWLWRLAVITVAALACFLARGWLLHGAASLLIDEDPARAADFVLPLGDAQIFTDAAKQCRSGQASKVLLIPPRPRAAQAVGALPTDEERMRRELAHGQAGDWKVTTIPCSTESDWDRFRLLGAWLGENPEARVTVLCGRFQSARCRRLLRAVLPVEAAARVQLRALAHADPDYDESNWWSCKEGALDAFNSSLSYGHVLLCGEDQEKAPWDPDQYEKSLR